MEDFFETRFGPGQLTILDSALEQWCQDHQVEKQSVDAELAAAALINLFREGHRSLPELLSAAAHHSWLTPEASSPSKRSKR